MVPSVSVIVPVFNSAATIKRALDSVLAQTFKDYELLVVDDGSSDETLAIVEATAGEAVTIIRHPANRGAAAARNTGIKAARGRWIAFLDGDDAWPADKLERQLAALKQVNGDASVTGFTLHKDGHSAAVRLDIAPASVRREILFGCAVSPGTTLLIERRIYDEVGLLDESLRRLEDWEWLLRFTERHTLICVADPLADVYVMSGSAAGTTRREAAVTDALNLLRAQYMPRTKSAVEWLQFSSSLMVERAASHFRAGRKWRAAGLILMSFAIYPLRNASFKQSIGRILQTGFTKRP